MFMHYAGMVDCIFADVAQPDQARIVAINAHHFLKNEGHVVISIKVSNHGSIIRWLNKIDLKLNVLIDVIIFNYNSPL